MEAKGSFYNGGLIEAQLGAVVTIDSVNGSITNDGDGGLEADGGMLTVNAAVTGSGVGALVADGGEAKFLGTFNQDMYFSGTGTFDLSQTTGYSGTVHGFAATDKIDFVDIHYDSSGTAKLLANNVLEIKEHGSTYDIQLSTGDSFTGEYFHLSDDGKTGHGTNIIVDTTAPCYCTGTLILTEQGEMPVEDLVIGQKIITKSGEARPIKWIGRRSYNGRFLLGRKHILPVCINAGALDANTPCRDLWISPHHAMYLEGVLIEARDLVNGVNIVQPDDTATVAYFHIELDTHDVIIAEGSLSETFIDDDSRGMFHNAHEYRALYPDASFSPAQYCAPRRKDGYEVEAARSQIQKRAGLRRPATQEMPLGLRGYVDVVTAQLIAGWAQNTDYPEASVCLDIYAGGQLIGQTLANRYRNNLERAVLGSGCHSFEFTPPKNLTFAPNSVEVRRSLDGVVIASSYDVQQPVLPGPKSAARHFTAPGRATDEHSAGAIASF